jgi:hypothetical protein
MTPIENQAHTAGVNLLHQPAFTPSESDIDMAAGDLEYAFFAPLGYRSLQAQDEIEEEIAHRLGDLIHAASRRDSGALDITFQQLITSAADSVTRNRSAEWWDKWELDRRGE